MRELADRLALIGDLVSSHFCHMVSGANVEAPNPHAKLVLLGVDHNVGANASLLSRESLKAFQRTEAFEWAKRKGNANACIPSLQAFKLMYAINVADYGYTEVALGYVKSIKTLIERSGGVGKYSPAFINALDVFEDRVSVCMERGGTKEQKEERKNSIFGSLGSGLKRFRYGRNEGSERSELSNMR